MLLQRQLLNLVVGRIGCGNHRYSSILYRKMERPEGTVTASGSSSSSNTDSGEYVSLDPNSTNIVRKNVIAVGQLNCTPDRANNMAQVKVLVEMARQARARFLFLPECCDFVAQTREQTIEFSEPLEGKTMKTFMNLAREFGMWLSFGVHEAIMEDGCKRDMIYNTHVILDSSGKIVQLYRKLHLFDVHVGNFQFKESNVVLPGNDLPKMVDTPIGKIGMQTCYDVRFSELSNIQRQQGAEILAFPSAFAYSTGRAHWEVLARARAIEAQCFVVAAAQNGRHIGQRQSWGHALIVNAWGEVLVDLGQDDGPLLGTATIDLDTMEKARDDMPTFSHRRHDVYNLLYNVGKPEATEDRYFEHHFIKKETIFYETDTVFAFTNLRIVVTGHVLVTTKRVVARLKDLTIQEMSEIFFVVNKIQRMLERYYNTTSATVTVQDGPDAGQTVRHVHFHVMPRRPGDFEPNDKIYMRLDDATNTIIERSMPERAEEAALYRKILKDLGDSFF